MILASVTGLAMAPALRGKLPYDPIRDFVPVAQVVDAVTLFTANPSSASKTLKDFVARAKKEPGVLTVGNPGIGSIGHLAYELFGNTAGIKAISCSLQERRAGSDCGDVRRSRASVRHHFIRSAAC